MKSSKQWNAYLERIDETLKQQKRNRTPQEHIYYRLVEAIRDLTEEVEALKKQQNPTPSTEKQ